MTANKKEPHLMRCETCKHFGKAEWDQWCDLLKERIANIEYTLIERVGCASHSSQPVPLCDSTHVPTQNEFIAEFVGNEQRKRDEHDAAIRKAERERVLALLEEWDYYNNRNFGKPHPVFADMIRLVREKPYDVLKHVESLRQQGE